ncbi:alkaline phosphatase family protein [bacterium]|nr:alkaline phosphatase family protein [bacterium]
MGTSRPAAGGVCWRWRGLIAAVAVVLAAAAFALVRRDAFASLLILIAISGGPVLTSPLWLTGGWLVGHWWRGGPGRRRRRWWLPALGVLLILPAVGVVSLLSFHSVRLAGHQDLLNGQDRYVVLIIADGGSFDRAVELFMKSARDPAHYREQINGAFPNISQHFLREGAYTLNGTCIWPSSSVPAHTSIMTGCYPGKHGILGQRYYERALRHHVSYIGLGITQHNNQLLPTAKTLFEYFPRARSTAVVQVANRGCTVYFPGPPDDNTAFAEWRWVVSCLNGLGKRTGRPGVPRVQVVTLASIDHASHVTYLGSEEIVETYKNVDRLVGLMIDFMGERGLLDKTTFVLCADHGIAPVSKHLTIDHVLEDLRFYPYRAFRYTMATVWGSFESNFWKGTRRKFDHRYDCLALWGGNSDALLYIKGQERDAQGKAVRSTWDIKPTLASLEAYNIKGEEANLIERILDYSPGVGFVVAHPAPDEVLICSREGRARALRRPLQGNEAAYRYDIVRGQDPLGYAAVPALKPYVNTGRWLSDTRWLDLTCTLRYPDVLHRMMNSFGGERDGDLHLVAAEGWDFTPANVSSNVLTGTHGGLDRAQSVVPIMFWGKGIKRVELKTGRTVDVVPTILALLDVPYDPSTVSGRPLDVLEP